ncbi:2-haloalkanoic acid dehalogenase [Sulfolobus acidocaldarius SUSAZ]|nr:2-haloalkanoic acid dehalogenase [Sulfolobus acidocaldarius SUSAZ]
MNKVIFIDMGETLVSFSPKFHQPIFEFLKDKGYNISEKQVFRAINRQLGKKHFPDPTIGGLSEINYYELLYDLKIFPTESLVNELMKLNLLSNVWELYEDAFNFIKEAKEMGYKLVLITNATKSVYRIIHDLEIDKYIDGMYASCDLGVLKPHPRIFKMAMEKHGRPVFHIGDVYEVDYIGALRAGINPVLLDRFGFYEDVKANKVKSLLEVLKLIVRNN